MSVAARTVEARAPLRVFLVACEESGDKLGAALMEALARRAGRPVTFSGVGGSAMAARGLRSLFPIGDLAIVGFNGVIARLPMILRHIKETVAAVLAEKPDVLVIIDSPDFTHRVAKRVRMANPGIPIVDYVSPTVWVWRPGRAKAMRRYVDHVLALLPFEPAAHARLGGPPCTYVGHPLVEEIAHLRPDERELQRRAASPPLVLVLPGSRTGEINRLLGVFGAAIAELVKRAGPVELVLPTVPRLRERVVAETASWPVTPRIVVETADKWAAFRSARAALAASGTVTLELALAGVPAVVAYRMSAVEGWLGRLLLHGTTIVLANLVLGENVMPEFVQGDVTPDTLATAMAPLLQETPERERQVTAFAGLDSIMGLASEDAAAPSIRAADIVLASARGGAAVARPAAMAGLAS